MRRRPDLDDDLFQDDDALLVIGDDLVLSWGYVTDSRTLEFVAREGDGTRLAVMARVTANDHETFVAPAVVAELLHGSAAAARRAFPENAQNT